MAIPKKTLDSFHKAALSLKLFSRAELSDEKNRSLVEKLYVDPLPNEQVFKTLLAANTTFLIGRKGTGKSTIFQRVQHEIRKNKLHSVSAYMDIRNVYEASQVDPVGLEKIAALEGAMSPREIERFLLLKRFFRSLLGDIRTEVKTQVEHSFLSRLRENLVGSSDEAFSRLDKIIARLDNPNYEDVAGYLIAQRKASSSQSKSSSAELSVGSKLSAAGPEVNLAAKAGVARSYNDANEEEYSQILMRIVQIPDVISELQVLLKSIDMKHLYIFLDDFSELPSDAMKMIVDTLISPLSRWSDFLKFKIAAYPGRVYLGSLDKTKIEEVNLDMYALYGGSGVVQMEENAIDFVKRLVSKRLDHHKIDTSEIFRSTRGDDVWRTLFYASMANPRTLGHILLYSYESSLIYGKPIGNRVVQDAAERFFDDKVLPFFRTGKFHLSFQERSSIYSLKELFEKVVTKARALRQEGSRSSDPSIGSTFSSHFYVSTEYEDVLQSLELAFFVTKYFEQSDREGKRVSIFCLNYGLCVKYQIGFGRPHESRGDRLYFVSRKFDFNGMVREYINSNQEIKCNQCGSNFDIQMLPALKLTKMRCLACFEGTCEVTNLSKKYEDILNSVNANLLLPDTELNILQALQTENRTMVAAEIASELDCSGQLIGRRGRKLSERNLVERHHNGQVYSYILTEEAKNAYFGDNDERDLNLDE